MSETERATSAPEQDQSAEASPTEKLHEPQTTGPLTPGAQNPESEEVKQEHSPNTE